MKTRVTWFALGIALLVAAVGFQALPFAQAADDPVVRKIIELGTKDNRVMTWNDFASNRFGGRETGTHWSNDATAWAAWQFRQFGLDVALEEVGELPVGFNRGPWFGKMLKPAEKALRFGTPSFTAGTKGIQRGPVVILKANPFSIPGRAQGGQPVPKENIKKKRAAIQAAIAEVNANKAAFKGAWVLIPGASNGFARDGRRGSKLPDGSPEYFDAAMMPLLTKALVEAGALGTIQSATPPSAIQPDRNSEPADQRPRRLRRVVGHASGPFRYQAAQHAVQRDQGSCREGGAGRPRVRHPQLVHDGSNQVPQRRRHPPRHDLPRRVHRHRRALRRLHWRHWRRRRRVGVRAGDGGHPPHRGVRREAEALDSLHRLRGGGAGPRRVAGVAQETPRAAREDRDDDQPRRQPERDHRRHGAQNPGTRTSRPSPRRSPRSIRNGRSSSPGACRGPTRQAPAAPTRRHSRCRASRRSTSRRQARGRARTGRKSRRIRILTPGTRPTTSTVNWCPTRSTSSTPRWRRRWWRTASRTSTSRSRATACICPTGSTPR